MTIRPCRWPHPLDDGTAVVLARSLGRHGRLDRPGADGEAYRTLMAPLVRDAPRGCCRCCSGPGAPAATSACARALRARRDQVRHRARRLALRGSRAPAALFAGLAAHSILPPRPAGHRRLRPRPVHARPPGGWPVARGGSQAIRRRAGAYLRSLGGEIPHRPSGWRAWTPCRQSEAVLLDVTPRQVLALAGHRLPAALPPRAGAATATGRASSSSTWRSTDRFPGAPRSAASRHRASRRHARGDRRRRRPTWPRAGEHASGPFVLVAQQSLFDPGRAPPGKHTPWAYCHVPNGSGRSTWTERIEAQIERFAPGFGDLSPPGGPWARPTWSATTPTTSAATSTAACRTCASCSPVPPCGPCPTPPPQAHLHLLVLHAARRRGARHVRVLGGPGRVAARPITTLGRPEGRPSFGIGGTKAAPLATSLGSVAQHLNVLVSVPFTPSSAVKVARMSRVFPLQPMPE